MRKGNDVDFFKIPTGTRKTEYARVRLCSKKTVVTTLNPPKL